jgi:hypothetical protein
MNEGELLPKDEQRPAWFVGVSMTKTNTKNTTDARREVSPGGSGSQWIRLPKPGEHEANTGLTRSVLTRLCVEGRVKSISLREAGKARGCRLVNLPSLVSYLASLEDQQNPEPGAGA